MRTQISLPFLNEALHGLPKKIIIKECDFKEHCEYANSCVLTFILTHIKDEFYHFIYYYCSQENDIFSGFTPDEDINIAREELIKWVNAEGWASLPLTYTN